MGGGGGGGALKIPTCGESTVDLVVIKSKVHKNIKNILHCWDYD